MDRAKALRILRDEEPTVYMAERMIADQMAIDALAEVEGMRAKLKAETLREAMRKIYADTKCVYAGQAYKLIEEMVNRIEQEAKNG